MTGEEILVYINTNVMILIPVLIFIGMMLKKVESIRDWTIPIILAGVGIILAVLIIGFKDGFTAEVIVQGILQGVLCAGMAVYVHQLTIQSTRKRIEDEDDI